MGGAGPTKARPHGVYRNSTPRSGRAFGGGVAPGAGAGGADGAHAEPALRPADQVGARAFRCLADVALRPGSAGRGGLIRDGGLCLDEAGESRALVMAGLSRRCGAFRKSLSAYIRRRYRRRGTAGRTESAPEQHPHSKRQTKCYQDTIKTLSRQYQGLSRQYQGLSRHQHACSTLTRDSRQEECRSNRAWRSP